MSETLLSNIDTEILESNKDAISVAQESLLEKFNKIENSTETVEAVDYDEEFEKEKERQKLIEEHNNRIYNSAEFKAEVIYNNILQSSRRILSGSEKRSLRRECLRKAKSGQYDYLFDPEKIKKREERQRAKFDAINKGDTSVVPINTKFHTLNELSSDTIDKLKEMANSDSIENS